MNGIGQIITFYSYKGGVGRSMALANIGVHLCGDCLKSRPHSVLLIDWDLEAPGLDTFFNQLSTVEQNTDRRPGLLEYFEALCETVLNRPDIYQEIVHRKVDLNSVVRIENFIVPDVRPGLDLMPAGSMDQTYSRRVSRFDWSSIWEKYPALITAFRNLIAGKYAYCLIDSRTGFNDISGLCTAVMPEKLVVVFSLNQQNLEGIVRITRTSLRYRKHSDDLRPLSVFPLASRVESAELKERENWLRDSETKLKNLLSQLYEDAGCELRDYFRDIFIPYIPYYAFGEKLAFDVEEGESGRAGSLRRAYEDFARKLTCFDYPWQAEQDAARNRAEAKLALRE